MPGWNDCRGLLAGLAMGLAGPGLMAQQPIQLYVITTPSEIAPGGCTKITVEARDASGQRYANVDGVQLYPTSYDYGVGGNAASFFVWGPSEPSAVQLCATPNAGSVSTTLTATIRGTNRTGSALLVITPAAPVQTAYGPAASGAVSPPQAALAGNGQPGAAPAGTAPGAPPQYAPAPQSVSPVVVPSQPTVASTGAPVATATAPTAPAAPTPAVVVPAAPPAEAKGAGGFFKKLGKHLKDKAGEVANQTTNNLANTANQMVDATAQTGTNLVAGATTQVTNAAQSTVGGLGANILPGKKATADNLHTALDAGYVVYRNKLFTDNTEYALNSLKDVVKELAPELKARPQKFQIQFHMDPGPNALDITLKRAAWFKAALIEQGVDVTRFEVVGCGALYQDADQPPDGGPRTSERMVIARMQ